MTGKGPSLFEQLNRWPLSDVAAKLGLSIQRRGGVVSAGPCPLCGAVTRHTKTQDKRGALGWKAESHGWKCFQCEAHGDGAALVAAKVCGTTKPPRHRWVEVERHCGELGLLSDKPGVRPASDTPIPAPPPRPPPRYPPASELRALWDTALPLDAVPSWAGAGPWCGDVRTYLASRGFDVMTLSGLDVARILPPKVGDGTAWWPAGWADRWRLAVLAFDAKGMPVTLQARAVDGSRTGPKTRNPLGLEVRGAIFADGLGRAVLAGTYSGPGVVVVEGLTDFLAAAQLVTEFRPSARPAVLGVVAGSAAALEDVRLPKGIPVNVLTDDDKGGDTHANAVVSTLWRSGMRRLRPPPIGGKKADLSDWLKHDRRAALAALSHGMEVVPYVASVSR